VVQDLIGSLTLASIKGHLKCKGLRPRFHHTNWHSKSNTYADGNTDTMHREMFAYSAAAADSSA
jgi:hypothetical protein